MLNVKKTLTKILTGFKKTEQRTLLWTNPNPSSGFSATTVLDHNELVGYDGVEIQYKAYSSYGMAQVGRADIGTTTGRLQGIINASGSNYPIVLERQFSVSNSGVTFADCDTKYTNSSGSAVGNGGCVPYKIYGIKLGGVINRLKNAFRILFNERGCAVC